ncbi:reverse transcriptase domain-containing protein [Tanacetum coccineum]
MSTHSGPSPTTHISVVRNTVGKEKEKSQKNPNEPASDAVLREFCDKNYNQLLPILAEKMHQEKIQQEKLKAVKARLNFEEVSQYSELGAPSKRRDVRKRLGPKGVRNVSGSPKDVTNLDHQERKSREGRRCSEGWKRVYSIGWVIKKRVCPHTPVVQGDSHTTAAEEKPKAITRVPAQGERSPLLRGITIKEHTHTREEECQKVRIAQEDTGSLNLRSKGQVQRTRTCPDHGEDPKDHLKIFQAAAKVERWAMPTWCHMFNSTLIGNARVWFDDLPPESIDSYDDLKEAFLANYLQQKKCIKDPVEIHHIKQREREYTEDFVQRFKIKSRDVKGAPEIPKSVDEMMKITTAFLRGEVAAGNQEQKKALPPWKQQDAGHR